MRNIDVFDTNMVVIPVQPIKQIPNPSSVLETPDFEHIFRQPFTNSQGLIIDNNSAIPSYSFESMRSQKSITLSALRIEAHDRSGNAELEKTTLPELMSLLLESFGIYDIKDVGANCAYTFSLDKDPNVIKYISDRILAKDLDFLPTGSKLLGATTRLVVEGSDGLQHTIAIEPLNGDVSSTTVFMSCNSHRLVSDIPSREDLNSLFQECVSVLSEIADKLFSA